MKWTEFQKVGEVLNFNIQKDTSQKTQGYKVQRLIQVFWAAEATLLMALLQRLYLQDWQLAIIVFAVGVVLSYTYFAAKKGRADIASEFFSVLLTSLLIFLMWYGEGARDEALLAFPAIFIFSLLAGSLYLAIGLLAVVVINVGIIGFVNELEIYQHINTGSSFVSSVLIMLLLALTSFATWLISKDLKNALSKLSRENARVKETQAEIEKLAHYDSLTQLPNRTLARINFDFVMSQTKRNNKLLCLMFLDLDDFKMVNDSLGHLSGDRYLQLLAKAIKGAVRESDVVCRLGGDEFLLILPNLAVRADAVDLANKILDAVKKPLVINGMSISCTCSIGLVFAPEEGSNFDLLCQKADLAMYEGKDKGKNDLRLYSQSLQASANESLELIAQLRSAVANDELELHYQPQVCFDTGKIIGAEALIRWLHPDKGMVSPAVFIPLAERSGQIIEIGDWILSNAIKQRKAWYNQGLVDFKLSINISPYQFKRGTLIKNINELLENNHLPGSAIEVEFTESVLIESSHDIERQLTQLKELGISLAIDDFGTGYSNLAYLKNFEISTLKIDQAFVQDIHQTSQNKAIVSAIVQMANSLGMSSIAEGIEDEATKQVLGALGCECGQGYLWAKPLPARQFDQYYLEQMSRT